MTCRSGRSHRRAQAPEWRGLANVRFEGRDVVDLSGTGPFDLITASDAILDQAHLGRVLQGIADVLTSDGVFLMAEVKASSQPDENVGLPIAPFR